MIELTVDIFGGMDFSSPAVWLVLGMLVLGSVLICAIIFLLFYKLKLIVPRSKLFDDEYVAAADRNHRRFLRFWRISFVFFVTALLVLLVLSLTGLWRAFEPPLRLWTIASLCGAMLTMPFAIGVGRHTPRANDAVRLIQQKRMLHELRIHETPSEKKKVYFLIAILLSLYLLAWIVLSLYRGLGFFGLIWRLSMVFIGMVGILLTLPSSFRAISGAKGPAKMKAASWCVALSLFLAGFGWLALPCIQDVSSGPLTVRAEVTLFTGRYLYVRDTETGEQHNLRLGGAERYFMLQELWRAWKDSQAFYGDVVMQATHRDAEDRPLYCTITFYPHTGYRVSVEDINY